ncbi:MAG: Holliday junction branch migration DNA helicase RuvB [Phycisphaerales bacterium JB037]
MATERIIAPTAARPEEEQFNFALRPTSIDEYVGQAELLERLEIAVHASRGRSEPIEHILLHGPPGLGKTTLAHVIAHEMGTRLHTTSGPALAKGSDLVAVLTSLGPGDVLFIDEIHRLPIAVEEFIYPAMEDFKIDVRVDSGLHARTVQIRCKPFTLIGATTRAGLLSAPLRSRFGLTHHLRYYQPDELRVILERSCRLMGVQVHSPEALEAVSARSRGTPRIANRLLRRVRDYAQVRSDGMLSVDSVRAALDLEGVDHLGLDELDRTYLRTIARTYGGGPVGLETIAATMNEDAGTLEDVVEPYLLQIGFLARTRRGRAMTQPAADHLGEKLENPAVGGDPIQFGLFTRKSETA